LCAGAEESREEAKDFVGETRRAAEPCFAALDSSVVAYRIRGDGMGGAHPENVSR